MPALVHRELSIFFYVIELHVRCPLEQIFSDNYFLQRNKQLLLLASDQGYLHQPVVWEQLDSVRDLQTSVD